MMRKIVWSFVAVLVVAVAAGVAYFSYPSYLPDLLSSFASKAPAPVISQADNTIASGPISAVSASSITVTKQDGTSASFGITPTTKVISQVEAGQIGKAAADLSEGTKVLVIPDPANSFQAQSITIVPMLEASADSSSTTGTPVTISGTVAAVSTTTITIAAQSGNTDVRVTKDTRVLSSVKSGQKGKALSDIKVGTILQVLGTTASDGVTADSVLVMSAVI